MNVVTRPMSETGTGTGRIIYRTRGRRHGPITRLMSPSDLGEELKPFVFLDLFDFDARVAMDMPLHPHSGIATVTLLVEGEMLFDDPASGTGSIRPGGVEWMRAGGGVWHGKEMTLGGEPRVRGFQLWLALPAALENGPVDSQYIEASAMPATGPATVILGTHDGVTSPVRAPDGVIYLLVRLNPGERWDYGAPPTHGGAWIAAGAGSLLLGDEVIGDGEMVLLDRSDGRVSLVAGERGAAFVIGSAVPHPHELALGYYSVHTNHEALQRGEARIGELRRLMDQASPVAPGRAVPVFRG